MVSLCEHLRDRAVSQQHDANADLKKAEYWEECYYRHGNIRKEGTTTLCKPIASKLAFVTTLLSLSAEIKYPLEIQSIITLPYVLADLSSMIMSNAMSL
jgi:hypothetical protein